MRLHAFHSMWFGLALMLTLIVTSESCVYDTTTHVCADGRRCKEGQVCALAQDVCIDIGGCGDGIVTSDTGEVCDDGNIVSGDGCREDCLSDETCGNGAVDLVVGETCDDGNLVSGDGCSATCQSEVCGNGQLDTANSPPEVCDDGNTEDADGCRSDCLSNETCGNGVLDEHLQEQCDEGIAGMPVSNTATCNADCTRAICGDGFYNPLFEVVPADGSAPYFEQCDNAVNSPGCDADCTFAACGDRFVNTAAGEQCDAGGDVTSTCDPDCTEPVCGDGFFNPMSTVDVDCDTAGDTQACDVDCTVPLCGDGYTNTMFTPPDSSVAEQCDGGDNDNDGIADDTTSCDSDCTMNVCGDGHPNAVTEQCDDGNNATNDGCPSGPNGSCVPARCGDGFTRTNGPAAVREECDGGDANNDGDADDTAFCDSDCTVNACGDGYRNNVTEECDDGNSNVNDDCPSGINGSCRDAFCGDTYLHEMDETCDNTSPVGRDEGCSAAERNCCPPMPGPPGGPNIPGCQQCSVACPTDWP